MKSEKTIRDELVSTIKDLRARGQREPNPNAMSDNDILYTVGYACALADTLDNTDLDQLIYGKFVEDWING